MATEAWQWDPKARRYKNAATGRFVATKRVDQMREELVDAQRRWADSLAAALAAGALSVKRFEEEFRDRVRRSFVAEFLLGRGGRHAWTASDRGVLGAMVREQYAFVRRFVREIANGGLTERQIADRSQLYFQSSRRAFERGRTRAWGMPDLPRYPADGSTACLANCRCSLQIRETEDAWHVTWRTTGGAEHCEDCSAQADAWNPLRIVKGA